MFQAYIYFHIMFYIMFLLLCFNIMLVLLELTRFGRDIVTPSMWRCDIDLKRWGRTPNLIIHPLIEHPLLLVILCVIIVIIAVFRYRDDIGDGSSGRVGASEAQLLLQTCEVVCPVVDEAKVNDLEWPMFKSWKKGTKITGTFLLEMGMPTCICQYSALIHA